MFRGITQRVADWLDGLGATPRRVILWTVGALLGLLVVFLTYVAANYIFYLYIKAMQGFY